MMDLEQCLQRIADYRTDEVVVSTMTANPFWSACSKSYADLIFTNPMGCAPSVAMGIALARPDVRVWVFNGDGCTLMYLGSLVSIAEARPSNLVFFLMDNREWGLIGHEALPGAERLDYPSLVRAVGWEHVYHLESLESLEVALPQIKREPGPVFVDLRVTSPLSTEVPAYYKQMARPEAVGRYGEKGIVNIQRYLESRPKATRPRARSA